MTDSTPTRLNSLPPIVTPEGEPIRRDRLKSAPDLVSQYETLYTADLESSLQRTMAQEQRDGVPPYSIVRERAAGLAGRANINWGMLESKAAEIEAPYNDVLDGIDEFCTMPTNFGDEASRIYWEQVISEEFSRMLRSWTRFEPLWQQNVMIFCGEGLSFAFFEDDQDWRWSIKGQQFMKFPRRVDADINTIDIMAARVEMLPHKLFEHCQDKEAAMAEGWHPDVVWETIARTAGQQQLRGNDLQEWQVAWKNNDLIIGATNLTVPAIHGWLRELDGTVSHYIAPADASSAKVDGFMYKSISKYRRMSNMVIPYFNGVGTNGTFQSIRGTNQKLFASCSGMNRVLNRILDMSIHESTPWIQVQDEDTLTELPLIPMGQYGVLKPGVAFVEAKVAPFEQTLIPAMNYLQQVFANRSGSIAPQQGTDKTERTKYEKQLQAEQQGRASTSGMNLFKGCWTQHLKEIARRVCRKGYSSNEPGGEEVISFRARCFDRGVPVEAIDQVDIDRIEVNLGLGRGSAQERRVVVDTLNQTMFYRLDPEGQSQLNNMTVAAYAGTRIASLISPVKQGLRPPADLEFANLENFVISSGNPIPVLPNQNHMVHIESHITKLGEINEGLTQQQTTLEQAVPMMQGLMQHTNEHMQFIDQNDPKAATFRDALNALNEVVENGAKQLFAEGEKAAREAAHNQPGGPAADPEAQQAAAGAAQDSQTAAMQAQQEMELNAHKANSATLVQSAQAAQKIKDLNLMTQQKLQHKELEFRQKMAIKDAEAAAKIRKGIQ